MKLIQPGSGRLFEVTEDSADRWRARGYRDVEQTPVAQPEADETPSEDNS